MNCAVVMTANELFSVIVRAIGLALLVAGVVALGLRLIDHLLLPTYELEAETALSVGWAFVAIVGVSMLLSARLITRLICGSGPD